MCVRLIQQEASIFMFWSFILFYLFSIFIPCINRSSAPPMLSHLFNCDDVDVLFSCFEFATRSNICAQFKSFSKKKSLDDSEMRGSHHIPWCDHRNFSMTAFTGICEMKIKLTKWEETHLHTPKRQLDGMKWQCFILYSNHSSIPVLRPASVTTVVAHTWKWNCKRVFKRMCANVIWRHGKLWNPNNGIEK